LLLQTHNLALDQQRQAPFQLREIYKCAILRENQSHLRLVSVTLMNSAVSSSALHTSARLDQCRKGTTLRVIGLLPQSLFGSHDEQVGLRLKELGFLPGARLRVIGFGLFGGDPMAVQVNGTKFALRRAEAAKICVEAVTEIGGR
jgi:ferrous iron transport protein A